MHEFKAIASISRLGKAVGMKFYTSHKMTTWFIPSLRSVIHPHLPVVRFQRISPLVNVA